MKHVVFIEGKRYLMVPSTDNAAGSNMGSCHGCALRDKSHNCARYIHKLVESDRCAGNLIYIEDTPESISTYVAERIT